MSKGLGDKLVLAISSRALFDLRDSHQIYESQGVEAYRQYQIEHEDEILPPWRCLSLGGKTPGAELDAQSATGRGHPGIT